TSVALLRKITGYGCWIHFFRGVEGIRDFHVTGVQTCALPISARPWLPSVAAVKARGPALARTCSPSSARDRHGRKGPAFCSRARQTAHDAPRILKAGSPNRDASTLTQTLPTPSRWATAGAGTRGVGA